MFKESWSSPVLSYLPQLYSTNPLRGGCIPPNFNVYCHQKFLITFYFENFGGKKKKLQNCFSLFRIKKIKIFLCEFNFTETQLLAPQRVEMLMN